jgi:DNA-binding NarL/FixJ family response regulator
MIVPVPPQTRVLIADDHPMVRRALTEALAESLGAHFEVLEAGSVGRAREILAVGNVDLMLLDLRMPGMDGALTLLTLRTDFPAVPVLVVSANEDAQVVRQAMEFGAAGFLPKSAPFEAIGRAARAVLDGDLWFPDVDAAGGRSEADRYTARVADLTAQQQKVFALLAQGKLNKEIAFELNVTEATIKAHMTQILQKLGVHSRTHAALIAQRLFPPQPGYGN